MKKKIIWIILPIILIILILVGCISYEINYSDDTNVGDNECCGCKKHPELEVCCKCKEHNIFKKIYKGYMYLFNKTND